MNSYARVIKRQGRQLETSPADRVEQLAADFAGALRREDTTAAIRAATALRACVDWIGTELVKESIAAPVAEEVAT